MSLTKDSATDQEKSTNVSVTSQKTVTFAGPLPPPSVLQHYSSIDPSFPERIFIMAEKEQNAVHELQKEAISLERMRIENQALYTKKGQYLATFIGLCFLAAALYSATIGQGKVAIAMVGFPLVGIIAVMITGRHKSQ
ncbi:MAG: DUF2335 domain-containing protein [Rickettsiales bacterium]